MKTTFKYYITVWAVCLALFNVTSFVVPHQFKDNFWVEYIFITLTFAGQLYCAHRAFRAESSQKFFYNIPIISVSYIGTLVMLVFGGLSMAVSALPVWVGIVVCSAILAFTVITVTAATAASETVNRIDKDIKKRIVFTDMLTVDAQLLMTRAKTPEAQSIVKKVYETLRYSDPVSCEELGSIESQITVKFNVFQKAVDDGSQDIVSLGEELIILLKDRNAKCKLLK